MRTPFTALVVAALLAWAGPARAADTAALPLVYNQITAEGAPHDAAFKAAYAGTYRFTDIKEGPGFKRAELLSAGAPAGPVDASGKPVAGYILFAYVISAEGKAIEPRVVKSTAPAINAPALAAIKAWRFEPARVDGKPVATLAGQEFQFGPSP